MDNKKIGQFIAEHRRKKGLTQSQLAEKLYVTDKAVSKWERGISMPDSSNMLSLCEILSINVTDLLKGERSEGEDESNDKLLLDMAKEIEQKNKTIWLAMWMIMIVSIVALFGGVLAAGLLMEEGVWQLVVIIAVVLFFLPCCLFALKLEISIGAYKCRHCGEEIVPSYKEAMMALHRGTTRYLKCPKCNKRSWCKKVINKK